MQYEILQTSNYDCGFVVLKVMLANLNRDKKYLLMPELKRKKYSFLDLKEIAKEHGLNLEGYKVDDIEILSSFNFPIICQIKKGKTDHFILLNKIKDNKFYIFDPNIGELMLSYDEFYEAFNNNIMTISEHTIKKYQILKKEFNVNLFCSLIFNLSAAIMFFISLFFINDYILFFLAILLGVVFLFLQKRFSQKFIKVTNETYNLNYDNLLDIASYQKQVISKISNIPSKIVLFSTIFTMMLNSYEYGYLNVVFTLIIIVIYYFFNNELKYESHKLEYLEQCKFDLKYVNKLSTKFANKISFMFITFSIFIAIFVFYMMQKNNLIGLDFFIMQFSLMFGEVMFSKEILSLEDIFKETKRKELAIDKYREKTATNNMRKES